MTTANPDWHAIQQTIANKSFNQPLAGGPVTTLLGTQITGHDEATRSAGISFDLGDSFINDNGVVMGGIVSAALDLSMAIIVMAMTRQEDAVATTNLQVQFFRPCWPGRYTAKTRIIKGGKSASFCEASLFDSEGKEVAQATCTNLVITR